jgi:hypothetical protein
MPVLLEQEMGAESLSLRRGFVTLGEAEAYRCGICSVLGAPGVGAGLAEGKSELPRGGAMTGPPVVPKRGSAMQLPARPIRPSSHRTRVS